MSVISAPRTRLPDQITVNFGPAEAAAQSILATDRQVRDLGLRLSLGFDFRELVQINQSNGKDWYALPPMFNPEFNDLNAENAFWLRGIDSRGEIALTHAVRLYAWSGTTLEEEVKTLRILYGDTARRADSAARGELSAPTAGKIAGRVSYSGALWVRSDFRGRGLARIIPPLSRAIALTRWYPEYHVCFVSSSTAANGMAQIYGYQRQEELLRFVNLPGFGPAIDFSVCWMTTSDAISEIDAVNSRLGQRVRTGFEREAREEALSGA